MVRLHPLSRSEVLNKPPRLLDVLFSDGLEVGNHPRFGDELYRIVAAGGYPSALDMDSDIVRLDWFDAYVESQVSREIREFSRVEMFDSLPKILQALAGQTAHPINLTKLAGMLELTRTSLTHYVKLLRDVFMVGSLDAWSTNRLKRMSRTPKLHMTDTGLTCALLRVDAPSLSRDRARWGQLLETFVVNEVIKETTWTEMTRINLHHFRDREGFEVDLVIDAATWGIAGIDVKAGATVVHSDFRGLRKLQRGSGDRFARGIVLYDGEACAPFGDGLWAVPAGLVWG